MLWPFPLIVCISIIVAFLSLSATGSFSEFLTLRRLFPSCCVWWGEKCVETGDNINNRNMEIMGPNQGGELVWRNEISLPWRQARGMKCRPAGQVRGMSRQVSGRGSCPRPARHTCCRRASPMCHPVDPQIWKEWGAGFDEDSVVPQARGPRLLLGSDSRAFVPVQVRAGQVSGHPGSGRVSLGRWDEG